MTPSNHTHPPRWAERFLRWVLNPADRDTITGDLLEEYRETIVPTLGVSAARRWYLKHALSLVFAPRLAGQWFIWLIATAGLALAFAMRYRLGPEFPDGGWAMLAIAACAMFSLRVAHLRFVTRMTLIFGIGFVLITLVITVGAALLSPRPDLHEVLVAYSGTRGKVLVASGAAVFIIAAFRTAAASQRIGVGVLTAMGTAVVGVAGWTVFVTGLASIAPGLWHQLGPLSSLAWPAWPGALANYLMLIGLSIAPALIGAMMGRAFAELRSHRSVA